MTTQLRAVPAVAVQSEQTALRDLAIEWAEQAAELTRTLASSLRRGDAGKELLQVSLAQARGCLALQETMIELLEDADQ